MEPQHLLSKEERHTVESKYGRHRLYMALRSIALEWDKVANSFSLSEDDLFYNTLHSLDVIKSERDKDIRLDHCRTLWNEVFRHIRSQVVKADEQEMMNGASLVVSAVDYCLCVLDMDRYLTEIGELKKSIGRENPNWVEKIQKSFLPWINSFTGQSLHDELNDYWKSSEFYSDIIAAEVTSIRKSNGNSGSPKQCQLIRDIANDLQKYFYNDYDVAEEYVREIIRLDAPQIHEITNRYYVERKISEKKTRGKIHKILSDHKIINETRQNWTNNVKCPNV